MNQQNSTPSPSELVDFWFAEETKKQWFKPDAQFDAALRERFEAPLQAARRGAYADWAGTANGALALILLLDQISRNIYRATPDAFAADEQALEIAAQAIANRFDEQLSPDQRIFLYMPYMHSEKLADQERGMELYARLGIAENLDYMRRHRDIIARFGRFPHRNAILDRQSTTEEVEFLKQPGSSF